MDRPVGAMRAAGRAVDGSSGPEWPWLAGLYAEMAAASRDHGAAFAVLAVPFPKQLTGAGPHPVQQRLLEMGRRGGYAVIDPLAAFRDAAAASSERLFLDWWHPSSVGHRLTADVSIETLACGGLLPVPPPGACPDRKDRRGAAIGSGP